MRKKNRIIFADGFLEEIFGLLTGDFKDLISIVDKDGYFTFLNNAYLNVLGYTTEMLTGSNIFGIIHKDDRDSVIEVFHNSFLNKLPFHSEFRIKDVSGLWHDFESFGSWKNVDIFQKDSLIMIARDISIRRNAEQKITEAVAISEQAAKHESRFLSSMSHEMRTPLNVILGYTTLLRELYSDSEIVPGTLQYFSHIELAVKRMLHTINQILDLSRIEAGEFPVEIEPVNIYYITRSVHDLMKIMAEQKKLRLDFSEIEKDIVVSGDEYCINGLITNLISNSIKYSETGSIKLSAHKSGGNAVVSVEDQGIGMSEEYLKHMFEDFKQEDSSHRRRSEGTGLGLALAKKYTELMNGTISVESQKGNGTKITIVLPLAENEHISGYSEDARPHM